MDLRQPEAHAHLVAVARRRPTSSKPSNAATGGVGVAARERDLAGEEQRVRLVVGRRLRARRAPLERLLRLVDVAGAQRAEAARDPVAARSRLGRDAARGARDGCGGRYCLS
jgi:hypothetical protein